MAGVDSFCLASLIFSAFCFVVVDTGWGLVELVASLHLVNLLERVDVDGADLIPAWHSSWAANVLRIKNGKIC